jgi:DNA replication protein DnaC
VRLQRHRGEDGFGRAHPCPVCASSPARAEPPERVAERMRIPAKFRQARISTWLPDNGRPRLAAQTYVVRWPPEKPLLLLSGNKGAGKTHLACGILHEVFERHGQRGQFWPVVDLLDRYRATFDEDRATETVEAVDAQLRHCAVLVLDDLGTHKSTEWAEERLFRLIDERYRDLRPLVVTTNAGLLELPDRIKSRLSDGACSTLVNFTGPDRRTPGDS